MSLAPSSVMPSYQALFTTTPDDWLADFRIAAISLFAGSSHAESRAALDIWLIGEIRGLWPELPAEVSLDTLCRVAREQPHRLWAVCIVNLVQARDNLIAALWAASSDQGLRLELASPELFNILDTISAIASPLLQAGVGSRCR